MSAGGRIGSKDSAKTFPANESPAERAARSASLRAVLNTDPPLPLAEGVKFDFDVRFGILDDFETKPVPEEAPRLILDGAEVTQGFLIPASELQNKPVSVELTGRLIADSLLGSVLSIE
jgi:hypothetical protein